MVEVGTEAPDFTLPDQSGIATTLSALRGSPVVLYFYPKDDTPGCTKEACTFRDDFSNYQARGARSSASARIHRARTPGSSRSSTCRSHCWQTRSIGSARPMASGKRRICTVVSPWVWNGRPSSSTRKGSFAPHFLGSKLTATATPS